MSGRVILTSPSPGKVGDVKVREGSKIKADDVVLIPESMKMEIKMRAKASRIIKEIKVKPGEAAQTGTVLAIIGSDRS